MATMKTIIARIRRLALGLSASLWFLPTVGVVGAIVAATALTRVAVPSSSWLSEWIFAGGAEGARGMLQAVAGSVITVTSLVFSLTVVALQLASSQFSPRLLRTFLVDRGNQLVLATFLATFAYSLAVLRTIRTGVGDEADFVPQVAVSVAFVLVMVSVAALVYFIHHITQEIQVDTMMRDVERDTRRTIEEAYPTATGVVDDAPQAPAVPSHAVRVVSGESGFLQYVDTDHLVAVAVEYDVVLRLHAAMGQYVAEAAPFVWVWRRDGVRVAPDIVEKLRSPVLDGVEVGHERTPHSDVGLGFRQLVDIAVKAMSTSLNDPTTAVHAIAHLTSLMCVLATREVGDLVACDDDDVVRVGVERLDFAGYLELVCGQIRRFGADEVHVARALLWMLREIAGVASPDHRELIQAQADLICSTAERELPHAHDRELIARSASRVQRALAGDLRP